MTPDAIAKGEVNIPDDLLYFLCLVITGQDDLNHASDRANRYVEASASDLIFKVTRGQVKPAKHLLLGLGLKSMMGSKKLLEILNNFGHCVSYHIVETLETDLATTVNHEGEACPDGILKLPNLVTGLAWDNYDENNETLSGAGTVHDTVGICYQNQPDVQPESADVPRNEIGHKRKRTFDSDVVGIEPYRKKPHISTFNFNILEYVGIPPNHALSRKLDISWIVSTAVINSTPMWMGYNSRLFNDPLPKQNITYMENICLPPTRLDVVVLERQWNCRRKWLKSAIKTIC